MDSIINMKDIHQSNDLKIFNKKDDEVKVSTSIGLTNKKKKIRCHICHFIYVLPLFSNITNGNISRCYDRGWI